MKDRIRRIMETQQMSQQEFAKKLGISPATLSSIFNGRTNPTNNQVQAIHRAFPAIDITWLMFGEGQMISSPTDSAGGELVMDFGTETDVPEHGGENSETRVKTEDESISTDLFQAMTSNQKIAPAPVVVPETKIIRRAVKEIRVFYDDGTYESFVPGN